MTIMLIRRIRRIWFRRKKTICLALMAVALITLYMFYGGGTSKQEVVDPCPQQNIAEFSTHLETLLDALVDPDDRQPYAWMRMRIAHTWPKWVKAVRAYNLRTRLRTRVRKKILVFIGALTVESRRNLAERQFKGGYLGELLQWSDVISGLYLLGHDVTIIINIGQLTEFQHFFHGQNPGCDREGAAGALIFTDIFGVRHIRKFVNLPYASYKCRLRVLDVFGTDPAWNDKMYAYKHNKTSYWGGLELNTQQFFTMYPENPDNSFIGFAVDTDLSPGQEVEKEPIALVYGKSWKLWRSNADYLRTFAEAGFELYATVHMDGAIPSEIEPFMSFVKNVGVLPGNEFKTLLKRAKVLLGLGSPIEGPAPMEALAHGVVYINPQFEGRVNLTSRKTMTERIFTSQMPYAETAIGEPHVYTVRTEDMDRVKHIAEMLMKRKDFKPVLPYEFTHEGYIQRLNVLLERQNFCKAEVRSWLPDDSVTFVLGGAEESCIQICNNIGRICEPSHFEKANTMERFNAFSTGSKCVASRLAFDIYYPAIHVEPNYCILQRNRNLFSCAGSSIRYQRLCPCRDFMEQQKALCRNCDF